MHPTALAQQAHPQLPCSQGAKNALRETRTGRDYDEKRGVSETEGRTDG